MSLIALIMLILAFLGFGFFTVEPDMAVSTVEVVTEVVEAPASGWTLVDVEGIQGVIVPADAAAGFGLGESYWTPTVTDVAKTEAAIAENQGSLLSHTRQYAGIVEDGERKILVNGFCSDEPNWMSQPIVVLDGGECYFTAIYNVDTSELEQFTFNGVA